MDRLFLRFYLHLVAALLLAAIAARVLVMPGMDALVERNMEEVLSTPTALVAETLADDYAAHRDVDAIVARAALRLGVPVALVPREGLGLDTGALARLDRGEVVRAHAIFRPAFYAAVGETAQVLRLGPLPVRAPLRGGRGTSIALLVVLALSLGVYALLRPVRRRLRDLALAAEALGRGQLGARAEVGAPDAFGTVAAAFNGMADEIQRLVAAQQELLHVTSHELRTPLQRLHFTAERVRDAEGEAAREAALHRMERDLDEMDDLIEELLTYVRLKDQRPEVRAPVDLGPLVEALCETLAEMAPGITVHGAAEGGAHLRANVEARLIRRAVSNLIVNAGRHARTRVEVTLERDGGWIRIDVDDDGPGVPPADRERIFEPFLRLEDEATQEGQGFGLGLAIVRRIAEVHGGSVTALASPLGGARFRLSLPA